MNKISTTWELAKVSWSVLRNDTELLWLPVLSAISAILVSTVFFAPLLFLQDVPKVMTGPAYIGLFLFYFCNYFVVIFFNTALIGAATVRLQGGVPSLSGGLSF